MTVLADAHKAATLDGQDVVHVGLADIAKWEDGPDGTLYVYGRATTPEVDTDEQIVDSDWSGSALKQWLAAAPALRVQHNGQRDPAGSGIRVDINRDGDGAHWIKGAVDEPVAQRLVKRRHLRAFSVGISQPVIERDVTGKARGGIIKGGRIVEVSLVDSPANRSCFLEIAKAAGDDGHAEFTGKVFGADLLTKDAPAAKPPKAAKTVTVELPKNMSVSITPAQLAKLAAFKRQLERPVLSVPEALKAAGREPRPGEIKRDPIDHAVLDAQLDAALKVAATTRDEVLAKGGLKDSERARMPASDFAYVDAGGGKHLPVHDEGHVRSALGRFAQQHFDSPAARKKAARKIVSRARSMGIDLGEHGTVVAAAKGKMAEPETAKGKGKVKSICPGCGAKQNRKHKHCPECGQSLPPMAPVVHKNHDFVCLGCGKELDKGEKYCPECGKANPGYLPEADKKIPANKAGAGKGRVLAKGKKKKAGKVGKQTPEGAAGAVSAPESPAPTPSVSEGVKEAPEGGAAAKAVKMPKEAKPGPVKKAKKKPKGGKKTPPWLKDGKDGDGDSDDGKAEKAAWPEDPELLAAYRLKSLGVPLHMGIAHDLTCPAFMPAEADLCYPGHSLKSLDLGEWQDDVLSKAASADLEKAMGAGDILDAAITLRAADPSDIRDLREHAHAAWKAANPGPGSFPTPTAISPERFRRPLISEGHEAPSPGHDAPHSAKIPPAGGIQPENYRRGYLADGRADDSPANHGGSSPMPAPDRTGTPTNGPGASMARDSLREGAAHAMEVLHNHVAGTFAAMCPLHPHVADTPVPVPQGHPPVNPAGNTANVGAKKDSGKPALSKADRKAEKARQAAKAAKARARKARLKARAERDRVARQVLKGTLGLEEAQAKLGMTLAAPAPEGVKTADGAPPEPVAVPVTQEALAAAVKTATAPLLKTIKRQGRDLRRVQKTADAIAGQPDTTGAPFRATALSKSSSPAGTQVAKSAEQTMAEQQYARLYHEWATTTDPAAQEALTRALIPYWNPAMASNMSPPA